MSRLSSHSPRTGAGIDGVATDAGAVQYQVPKVGTFTLSYCGTLRAGLYDDTTRVRVAFGRDDDASSQRFGTCYPEAPVLYGIELSGTAHVEITDALEHLARPPERRSRWWIRVHRVQEGRMVEVPDGTRRKVADIIADLVEDFLTHPEATQNLQAHRRCLAPHRVSDLEGWLTDIDQEITSWSQLRDQAAQLLAQQQAIADGRQPARPVGPAPDLASRALTRAGEAYLRRTGLAGTLDRHRGW